MLSFSDILAILPQQLVFGIALGTVYGLIAIGYTMVYGVLFMINFAHGEVFMIGAYIGWGVLAVLLDAHRSCGCIRSGCCRCCSSRQWWCTGAARPAARAPRLSPALQRGATRLGPLISAVGASIFLQNAVMLIAGRAQKVYMTYVVFPRAWRFNSWRRQHLGPGRRHGRRSPA